MPGQDVTAMLLLLFSPFIGSYLGVLVDRLPRRENTLSRPSACRVCAARLGWRDLVPVASFLLRKGRCGACGAAIPQGLVLIELAAIGAAALAIAAGGSSAAMISTALWLWVLIALAGCDWTTLRLPNPLTFALFLAGVAMSLTTQGPSLTGSLERALIGAVIGAGSFMIIRLVYARLRGRDGLGMGDVKLMAGIGAGLSVAALPLSVLCASLAALGWAALDGRGLTASRRIPFGSFLCAGAALAWLVGPHMF